MEVFEARRLHDRYSYQWGSLRAVLPDALDWAERSALDFRQMEQICNGKLAYGPLLKAPWVEPRDWESE